MKREMSNGEMDFAAPMERENGGERARGWWWQTMETIILFIRTTYCYSDHHFFLSLSLNCWYRMNETRSFFLFLLLEMYAVPQTHLTFMMINIKQSACDLMWRNRFIRCNTVLRGGFHRQVTYSVAIKNFFTLLNVWRVNIRFRLFSLFSLSLSLWPAPFVRIESWWRSTFVRYTYKILKGEFFSTRT